MEAKPNLALAKKLNIAAWIITVAVLALVGGMRRIHIDLGMDFTFLPPIYSTMNALAAVALMGAFYFIKQKNVEAHRKCVYVAFTLSVLFLLTYVFYHITSETVVFEGEGTIRTIYLILLLTHVVLATVSFPFILFTMIRGYTGQVEKHRKMAKWVFPIWLYVAVTGPICYYMLYQM